MHWVDIAIGSLIVLSGLISLVRGFIKEAVSLCIWVVSVFLAFQFAPWVGSRVFSAIHNHGLNYAVAFIIILLACLLIGVIINALVSALVKKTGATALDRFLGVIFGLMRGVIVVTVLVMLATFTRLPQAAWWKSSRLIPQFKPAVVWLKHMLPQQVAGISTWFKTTEHDTVGPVRQKLKNTETDDMHQAQ